MNLRFQGAVMPLITLTTDFGCRDAYVGSMKGVILGIHPGARIVDLSHEVGPQNVREAAFLLASSYRFFPKGTIHVVVVDPGVGSRRRILCAKTDSYFFLAPDNGVLTPILKREPSFILREVANAAYFLNAVSSTFHGRDKFSPVAAHLARKNIFHRLGPRLRRYHEMSWSQPRVAKGKISGEVIHVDRFGNLITSIESSHLRDREMPPRIVKVGSVSVPRWAEFYAEGKKGELMALMNSGDYLEIAVREGSAARKTRGAPGSPVSLFWS